MLVWGSVRSNCQAKLQQLAQQAALCEHKVSIYIYIYIHIYIYWGNIGIMEKKMETTIYCGNI